MREDKRRRLEAKGWKVGTAQEFLHLSTEEAAYIDLKARLATGLRERGRRRSLTQGDLARRLQSSQSRIAGTSRSELSRIISARSPVVAHRSSGRSPGPLRYPCQHAWSDLLILVKGEHDIGPTRAGQRPMGARLTLYRPPDPQESCQHPSSTGARPRAHATAKEMLRS